MEVEHHLVMAGLDVDGAQHVVDAAHGHLLSIDRRRPSRVVDLGEDDQSARLRAHLVLEVVGLVGRQLDRRRRVERLGLSERLLKLLVGHGLVGHVDGADAVELLVGVIYIADLVHKPGVALGVGVAQRHGLSALQRQDEVAGVEHIEHGERLASIHLRHVAIGGGHGLHAGLHLGTDISLDQLLIAAELGCMIASDALMEIGGIVLVEGVRGEVEHAVVEVLVLQDQVVGLRGLHGRVALASRHEHPVVEVALVHLPQIHEAEHGQQAHEDACVDLFHLEEQETGEADEDDDDRSPCVGRDHRLAHRLQAAEDHALDVGRHALDIGKHLCFLVARERTHHARDEGQQQGDASRQTEADIDPAHLLAQEVGLVHDPLEGQDGEQRNGKFGNHENRGHRAELRVHRHVVDEEVGQRHEIFTP